MNESMSLDQLLASQGKGANLVIIEAVDGQPGSVKITPWVSGVGCLCQYAFVLPKNAIESVQPTGDRHFCCGKTLLVVEVQFVKGASIELSDLFGQVIAGAGLSGAVTSAASMGRGERPEWGERPTWAGFCYYYRFGANPLQRVGPYSDANACQRDMIARQSQGAWVEGCYFC